MTKDEIIAYYVSLLIIQYNNKPKAKATVNAIVDSILANNIYMDIRNAYDIDTAVGKQLDFLGKYIGVDRFFLGNPFPDNYFGFADAQIPGSVSSNIVGFDDADSPDKEGLFLNAEDVVSNDQKLNDESYRRLLKLKIIQNHSDHSAKSISESIKAFFDDDVFFKDNQNMTITYLIGNTSVNLIRAILQKKVLPKPAGVRLEALAGNAFFGFADASKDIVPDYLIGFTDAAGTKKTGLFLNSNRDII